MDSVTSESILCLGACALSCLSPASSLQALTMYPAFDDLSPATAWRDNKDPGTLYPTCSRRQGFLPQINRAMLRISWTQEAEFHLKGTS